MKRTAKALTYDFKNMLVPLFEGLEICCECVGEMADGTKVWRIPSNPKSWYSLHHFKANDGKTHYYFLLEGVN